MIKLTEIKGKVWLETDLCTESVRDHTGVTTFIYLDDIHLEKLAFEAWAMAFDRGLRKLSNEQL